MEAAGRAVHFALKHPLNGKEIRPALADGAANAEKSESTSAQQLAGSMIDPGQQNSLLVDRQSEDSAASAEAADAPRGTAAADPTTAATAAATPATAATAGAATAAATTAAPGHLLHAALAALLVEQVEGREAHIGDFLFAENVTLVGDRVERLRDICCRQRGCGCAPRQRKAQSSGTQSRHCGGFGDSLPPRSLFHP